MDLLSRLLTLMPVTGRLDARCHFGAPWRLDHPASGAREIPYHVLLRGEAQVDDGHAPPLRMRAGDIVLFPSGVPHVLRDAGGGAAQASHSRDEAGLEIVTNDGDGPPADLLCGRFLLPEMPRPLWRDDLPARMLVHSDSDAEDAPSAAEREARVADSRLARLIGLMREEALERGPGSATLIDALSGALFALTLRHASVGPAPPGGLLALAQRPRLQPALAAMLDAPDRPWTLPDLAALCHMSRASFARHFDDAIGRSASDVLAEIRMALASRMLAHDARPVAEIGEAVGYQSEAAFQRAFKRLVGLTPAQWRAQARQRA
ncbi:AraC family transcriptional regulator [Burkholderia sp. FERM BP-3421]|jgi:AraC family transcriptional activator of mtrCDE|uniref:cupin domain-containing protein n=1 Tax=Burkholderia sp. FERM BP-3421 TaxID=1494466 RepID=UPI002362FEB6|nr:AraC family transcriptional regulator [Burkholderia sp. FERM BP-3421]WDD91228.1 AraC family transcriptional regulator [Burkholderia sp. FERM BP-3421]